MEKKTNVKFKKVSSYVRQLRSSKFPHPAAATKEKKAVTCFDLFSSEDPCLWKPRLSSKQQCTRLSKDTNRPKSTQLFQHSISNRLLGLEREDGGCGKLTLSPEV